jgi:hypothetical protein
VEGLAAGQRVDNGLRVKLEVTEKLESKMKMNYPWFLAVNGMKRILIGLVLAVAVMAPHLTLRAAGPTPIDLKSAAHFAVLGGSTVTSTGGGIIHGDVGLSPAGSVEIPPAQVNGTIYNTTAVLLQPRPNST